ncbi:ZCHC4 protein, partial [Polypterus senegalus]
MPIFWIFPYFFESRIKECFPTFSMLDYQVDYENHALYKHGKKGRRQSPVRIFTNLSPRDIILPSDEGYRFCSQCQRYVSSENKHCDICDACPSKDGRQWKHCLQCNKCVKPRKGKSFILNLLLLMTADTDEEYQEYIKNNEGILPLTQERLKLLHKKGHTEIIPEIFAEELENAEEEEDSDQKKEKILKMMQNCCYTSSISLNRMAEMMKAEEKSFSALKKYCESDGGNLRDFRSYLLPEKGTKKTHISTTKSVVRLHYGRIYQMKVKYMSKEDLQNQLYELVEIARDFSQRKERGLKESKREESQRLSLEKRFKILTTHFQEGNIDQEALMQIESPDCILLKEEVKTFAGTTAYFIGLGKNATEDRLFIREKLREMITLTNVSEDDKKLQEMKIAAVKDIVVFAPCKLLCGGKELIEMPGTDESDPLAQHEIGNILDKGDPTEIMGQFESNLQHTGVYKVMEELDQFGFMNLKPQLDDAKVALIHLKEKAMHYEVICKRKASQAEETIRIWKIKEIKDLKIDYFLKEHDKILQHTKSSLNEKRKQFINGKVAKLLKEWGRNASEKWKMSKSKVTNRAVFNPYFNGRHPNYKEKLREMITLTNVSADQEKLQEMKIAAVKEIVVYAPCKLLCGQKELIEMPGTDESDPLALHDIGNILNEVN